MAECKIIRLVDSEGLENWEKKINEYLKQGYSVKSISSFTMGYYCHTIFYLER